MGSEFGIRGDIQIRYRVEILSRRSLDQFALLLECSSKDYFEMRTSFI